MACGLLVTSEKVKLKPLSRVWLLATPWTVAYQAPLSMGFFQARVLEWIAISFSRGSSWPRNQTQVSRIAGRGFTIWAAMGGPRDYHTKWRKSDKDKYYMISLIGRIWRGRTWYKRSYLQNRNRVTDIESKLMVNRGERWGREIN